jgi:hypothetical protein
MLTYLHENYDDKECTGATEKRFQSCLRAKGNHDVKRNHKVYAAGSREGVFEKMKTWQAYRYVREKGDRGPWPATYYTEHFTGVRNDYTAHH